MPYTVHLIDDDQLPEGHDFVILQEPGRKPVICCKQTDVAMRNAQEAFEALTARTLQASA